MPDEDGVGCDADVKGEGKVVGVVNFSQGECKDAVRVRLVRHFDSYGNDKVG